jgi:hypothetical protein
MMTGRRFAMLMLRALTGAMLLLGSSGCGPGGNDAVRVALKANKPSGRDLITLDIQAQVSGPPAGLRYQWFSISGECEPQESAEPATVFRFAEGVPRDRVSVEVWRGDNRVSRSEIDVTLDEERLRVETERVLGVKIEITNIPPFDLYGGHDTHADISGVISGKSAPDYKVIIYTRVADTWYIQPVANAAHAILPDNTWADWTHTGTSYAALLVRPGYEPSARLDLLPPVGGYVAARTVVDGVKK